MKMILFLFFLLFPLLMGFSAPSNVWEYDLSYTMDLMFNTSGFSSSGISNSVASVNVIQIYNVERERDHVLSLKELRRQKLVCELREKDSIEKFFDSFQRIDNKSPEGCSTSAAKKVFHIVAFDATLMRMAYFRYYLCSGHGIRCGIIKPLGDEGIFYNTSPPSLFIEDRK